MATSSSSYIPLWRRGVSGLAVAVMLTTSACNGQGGDMFSSFGEVFGISNEGPELVDQSSIKQAQTGLNRLGYGAGTPDGISGPATKKALREYQADYGVGGDGRLTQKVLRDIQDKESMTAEERNLRRYSSEYKVPLQAALLGCGLGMLASGFESTERVLLFCLGGGVLGGGAGFLMKQRVDEYGDEQRAVDSLVDDAEAENRKAERVIASANKVISADLHTLEEIERKKKKNNISQAEVKKQLASVNSNISVLEDNIADMKTRKKEWDALSQEVSQTSPEKSKKMAEEAAKLETKIARLQESLSKLKTTRGRVSRV